MSGEFAARMGARSDAFSHAHSVFVNHVSPSVPPAVSTARGCAAEGAQKSTSPSSVTGLAARDEFLEMIASGGTVRFAVKEEASSDLDAPPFAQPVQRLVSFAGTRREEALCMSWCIKFAARSSRAAALAEGSGDDESALRFARACIAQLATTPLSSAAKSLPPGHTTTLALVAFVTAQWPILRAESAFGEALIPHAPALRYELCERALDCARSIVHRKSARSTVELFTHLAAAGAPSAARCGAAPLTTLTCVAARSGAPRWVDAAAGAEAARCAEEWEEERAAAVGVASAARSLSSAATHLLVAFCTAGGKVARTKTEGEARDKIRVYGRKRSTQQCFPAVARNALVAHIDGSAAALSTLRAQLRSVALTAAVSARASAHPASARAAHDVAYSAAVLLSSWLDALHTSSSAHALSPPPGTPEVAPMISMHKALVKSTKKGAKETNFAKETDGAAGAPAPATPTLPRGNKQRRRRPRSRAYAARRQRASRARRARAALQREARIVDAATVEAALLTLDQRAVVDEHFDGMLTDVMFLAEYGDRARSSFDDGMSMEEGRKRADEIDLHIAQLETLREAMELGETSFEQTLGDPRELLTSTLEAEIAQQMSEMTLEAEIAQQMSEIKPAAGFAGKGWRSRHEMWRTENAAAAAAEEEEGDAEDGELRM